MKQRGLFFQIGLWLNRYHLILRFVLTGVVFVINELYMREMLIRLGCMAGVAILIAMAIRERKYSLPSNDEEWYAYICRNGGWWGASWLIAVFGVYIILSMIFTLVHKKPMAGDDIMEWVWRVYFCLSLVRRWCRRTLGIELKK